MPSEARRGGSSQNQPPACPDFVVFLRLSLCRAKSRNKNSLVSSQVLRRTVEFAFNGFRGSANSAYGVTQLIRTNAKLLRPVVEFIFLINVDLRSVLRASF